MKNAGSRKSPKKGTRGRNWLRWVLLLFLGLLVLPILQTGCVRWVDPPVTPLMLLRKAEARLDGKIPAATRYEWRSLNAMPREFLHFALVAEDQRFFQHNGFDWKEVRAAQRDAKRTGKPMRGASTISMQCARSLFLWQGRSWIRKGLEFYYTFWLETFVPKHRILELYANVAEMGDGVYGVAAASRAHFGVDPRALTREQCARLAALLPAPRQWNPNQPTTKYERRVRRLMRNGKTTIPGWKGLAASSR